MAERPEKFAVRRAAISTKIARIKKRLETEDSPSKRANLEAKLAQAADALEMLGAATAQPAGLVVEPPSGELGLEGT